MLRSKETIRPHLLTLAVISALALTGCNDDSESTTTVIPPTDSDTPTEPEQTLIDVIGVVVDKDNLDAIADATITVQGVEYTSDAEGKFELPSVAVGEPITLIINAEGYPERSFTTMISGTADMTVEYQLSNDETVISTIQSATTAINLDIEDLGASVSIPANALRRADGQPIIGDVTVNMDVVTPSVDPEEMPGGYGIVGGGFMESWGAMVVTATDSADNELVLADGSRASLVIPVSTRSLEPLKAEMPLFYYNSELEGWVQTGNARLQTLANGIEAYVSDVEQIGPWNVDVAMQTVNVTGCVADTDGERVDNALVKSDGISYSSVTTTRTNNDGVFTLPVRQNSSLYVYAQNGNRTSNAKPVTTLDGNYRITDGCLTVSTENDNLSIRLTWGQRPRDADSHLITPSGDHIYFVNKGSLTRKPFANLDVDDTNSFGPEFVTVRNLMVGRYHYGVNNFSRTNNPGLKQSPVSVFLSGPTIRSRTLTPTLDDNEINSRFWHSFDLVVDEQCNITYETVDRWLTRQEANSTFYRPTSTTPTYCVAP